MNKASLILFAFPLLQLAQPPAENVYKNLQLLKGVPASQLIEIMNRFNQALGVECAFCHVPDQWEKEDKPHFTTTRTMLRMTDVIKREYLNEAPLECWTCHRGTSTVTTRPPAQFMAEVKRLAADAKKLVPFQHLSSKEETLPAERVYKNIQLFRGLPARGLAEIMAVFRVALGVNCTHCHAEHEWQSDAKPTKDTARRMFRMVRAVSNDFFNGKPLLHCWHCHQGSQSPERSRPGTP